MLLQPLYAIVPYITFKSTAARLCQNKQTNNNNNNKNNKKLKFAYWIVINQAQNLLYEMFSGLAKIKENIFALFLQKLSWKTSRLQRDLCTTKNILLIIYSDYRIDTMLTTDYFFPFPKTLLSLIPVEGVFLLPLLVYLINSETVKGVKYLFIGNIHTKFGIFKSPLSPDIGQTSDENIYDFLS